MASEYSVNISLDTTKAEGKLKNLKKGIDGLTSKKGGAAKKELSAEEQLLKIENQQLIVKNKGLGLTLKALPLEQKGIKIKKAEKLIRAANVAASQEDFDLAKKNLLLADKRIKKAQILVRKNQDINKSTAQSLKGGSTGFTAAQYGPQMASTKGAGQVAMNINTILAQSEKRLGFEVKLRNLEAQGVNTAKLRVKMGELVDAQNRKEFGSIDRINRKIRMGIKFEESKLRLVQKANAERAKEAKLLDASVRKIPGFGNFTASQYGPQLPGIFDAPQGAFSRLSDRQSRDKEGRRTGLNNMFGSALTRAGATRGFDTQSALISGAFPLLFGQGPVGAAAGALGGGIGGMFGQMGGFAGGIAATAIVQQIHTALKAISDLGQAMGPFTQNTESVTAAIGLQGSAEEARIRLIEQSEGKTAAFNASMQLMANRIGQDGVDSLKEFGDTTRLMNSEFTLAITKIQAFTAGVANFVLRITGLQENLNAAAATRTVADAAATGNVAAQNLVSRRESIERMGSRGGEGKRKATLLAELEAEEKIFAIMQNTTVEADVMTQKFDELVKKITQEEEETARILELRKEGLNPEIAKTIAGLEKEARTSKESLDTQIKLLLDKQKEEGILGELDQTRLTTLEK